MTAPVAGDAVAKLPVKWRALADKFEEIPGDVSRAEAASMRNDADQLDAALAQDRASQGAVNSSAISPEVRAELLALAKSWYEYKACPYSYTHEEANQRELGYENAADELTYLIERHK